MEYFPEHQKVFLVKIHEKIKNDERLSADLQIHDIITQYAPNLESVAFDAPLTLPKCMTCELKCPGFEACGEPEIKWMRVHSHKKNIQKKPKKIFTPYTQRAVELYIKTELKDHPFHLDDALGANLAPLTARAHFIQRRLKAPTLEVFPELTLWRIGRALGVGTSHLKFHKHSVGGDESRHIIIKSLSEHNVVFLYQHDIKLMVENNHAFEAFICALTGYLKHKNQTEKRPPSFPKSEGWLTFPINKIKW